MQPKTRDLIPELLEKANDPVYKQNLFFKTDDVLLQEGVTDEKERKELKTALLSIFGIPNQTSEVQKLLEKQMATTLETADKFKSGLRDTVEQIEKGYNSSMTMYKVAFYLGVLLILFACVWAGLKGEAILPIVFGGLGMVDIITYFITKPPQDLQDSRANLAQLQAAYYNWFADNFNWNSFIQYVATNHPLTFDEFSKISDKMLSNTDKTMEMIEKYCERKP